MGIDGTTQTISKFNLDGDQRRDLEQAGKLVVPKLDQVLDRFYAFAKSDDEASLFFRSQDTLDHARGAQKRHWELLLRGDFSQDYFDSANRIGRVHFRIQLPFDLYLAGYARATSDLQLVLAEQFGATITPMARKRMVRLLGALNRVFALDTYQVIDAYFAAQGEEQDTAFRHLTDGIQRMSARDLTQPIPSPQDSDFPARYDNVRQSFNTLMDSIGGVIGTMQDSAVNLSSSADEISDAAEDLSSRTETQAATLEETAAAVEEITASMKQSSEATTETSSVAHEAQGIAEDGRTVAADAVEKMNEISASSHQISQIISVIDDIAFQTNLLALNAGVEAARAGEAGRGFAVVASEVRALAQRAAVSAKEIKDLINVSAGHVDAGVDLVSKAGAVLERIVGHVKRVTELSSDVASSAQEQFTGLSEINTGVSHMDSVTQQNAAMVEQTTAATMTMRQDTRVLADLVQTFRVSGAAPAAAAPASSAGDWEHELTGRDASAA
ncbi:globin-coupled sensor protein [Leisingera aquaemixtae]|uniref:methyl-accepting chemotaxis protein n=1 Tax=Leisingera aquaemixtae TaxID=1396826 RepID=UPI001C98E198|nr:globin-coupled sensor protein [Leisingera aquaemixtae]MBY6066735.1 globin-coupled sensor protein [Leisingera aquaemixtae]